MQVALYTRKIAPDQIDILRDLIEELEKNKIAISLHKSLVSLYNGTQLFSVFDNYIDIQKQRIDYFICLGGDGTILDSVTFIRDSNIPILGINLGRLGFLVTITKEEIKIVIEALLQNNIIVEKRHLLHLNSNKDIFKDAPFALNEFSLLKRDISSMIKINAHYNGEFLNTYWADGLIVATPTGSTGYNLSCGGPVVFPESRSFVITPVSPHNLNIRSIIVPSNSILSFDVEGRSNEFICTLDARSEIVNKDISLAVKEEDFEVSLVRLEENSFLMSLKNKLTWGYDKRN